MDHSHFKLKDETKDQVRRGEDHLKEKILHAHDNAIPQKVEIGNKPHRHDEHQGHKDYGRHGRYGDHHRMMIQDF